MRKYIIPIIVILIIYITNCSLFTPAEYWHDSVISNHIFSDGIISFALNTAYNEIPYDHAGYRILVYNMETGLVADQIVFTDNEDDPVHICKTNNYIYSSQSKYKININTGEQELIEDTLISDLIDYEVSPNGEECIYYIDGAFKYINFATDEMRNYDCSYSEGRYDLEVDWIDRIIIYIDSLGDSLSTINIDTYEDDEIISTGDIINNLIINKIQGIIIINEMLVAELNVSEQDSNYIKYIEIDYKKTTHEILMSDEQNFYSNEKRDYYIEIVWKRVNNISRFVLDIYDESGDLSNSFVIPE